MFIFDERIGIYAKKDTYFMFYHLQYTRPELV